MADTTMSRPLKFWEQICSNMGVTMGFQLEGKLDAAAVKSAYEYIQKVYPFLRMVLKQANNTLSFVEHPSVSRFSFLSGLRCPVCLPMKVCRFPQLILAPKGCPSCCSLTTAVVALAKLTLLTFFMPCSHARSRW